ncbi:MAG: endonuclease/exonuclease/phosphatase family protein [Planctomycetota bacterium]
MKATITTQLRRGLVVTAIVAASLATLLLALTFLQRLDWRLDLLSHLRLHLIASLVVAAVALSAMRRLRVGIAAASVALAVLIADTAVVPGGPERVDASPDLVVVHANTGNHQLDRDAFDAWFATVRADVVLLQEVTPHTLEHLESRWPEYTVLAAEPRWDTRGVAVLVKAKRSAEADLLHPLPDKDRPIAVVTLDVAGTTTSILHFSTTRPLPRDNFEWQAEAFEFAAQWANEERSEGRVPLLVGDFNQTPRGWQLRDLCRETGLSPMMLRSWRWPLPRVAGLAVNGFLVPDELLVIDKSAGPYLGGDHWPVIASFAADGQLNLEVELSTVHPEEHEPPERHVDDRPGEAADDT